MITKEVNDWIKKVENGNYSSIDILEELSKISRYLTKEEFLQIKRRLTNNNNYKL